MTMTSDAPAACCGQTGKRHTLWLHSRTTDEIAAIAAEDDLGDVTPAGLPIIGWAARPEHAGPPPTPLHARTLRSGFDGRGLRVIAEGANRRWPRARPTAVLVCAECGRGRCLGNPPRGWASGRPRWYQWFTDHGVNIAAYRTSSTVYDGMAIFTVAEVAPV